MNRVCQTCRIRRVIDDDPLCSACGTWRHELQQLSGVEEIPVELIRYVLPTWLHEKPQCCIRISSIAKYCARSEAYVLSYCETHNFPVLGLTLDPPRPVIVRQFVPIIVQAIRWIGCAIPNCSETVIDFEGLRLCASHRQFLDDHFREEKKELDIDAFLELNDRENASTSHAARVFAVDLHTVNQWVRKGKLARLPSRDISTSEIWRLIGQLTEALPLKHAQVYLKLSKMQMAHFAHCPSCKPERPVVSLKGHRVFSRFQLPILRQILEKHKEHNKASHDWSTRIKPGELSAEMLEQRLGINFNNRQWLEEVGLLEYELRPPSLRIYTEAAVATFLDKLQKDAYTVNWPFGLKERILSHARQRQTTPP